MTNFTQAIILEIANPILNGNVIAYLQIIWEYPADIF